MELNANISTRKARHATHNRVAREVHRGFEQRLPPRTPADVFNVSEDDAPPFGPSGVRRHPINFPFDKKGWSYNIRLHDVDGGERKEQNDEEAEEQIKANISTQKARHATHNRVARELPQGLEQSPPQHTPACFPGVFNVSEDSAALYVPSGIRGYPISFQFDKKGWPYNIRPPGVNGGERKEQNDEEAEEQIKVPNYIHKYLEKHDDLQKTMLLNSTRYLLNISGSQFLDVWDHNSVPMVTIGGGLNAVVMTQHDWYDFLTYQPELEQKITTQELQQVFSANFGDFTMSFSSHKATVALTIESGTFCVILGREALNSIFRLKDLINRRLTLLKLKRQRTLDRNASQKRYGGTGFVPNGQYPPADGKEVPPTINRRGKKCDTIGKIYRQRLQTHILNLKRLNEQISDYSSRKCSRN